MSGTYLPAPFLTGFFKKNILYQAIYIACNPKQIYIYIYIYIYKVGSRARLTRGLIAQSVRGSERNLVVVGFKSHSGQLSIAASKNPSVVNTIHILYMFCTKDANLRLFSKKIPQVVQESQSKVLTSRSSIIFCRFFHKKVWGR